MSATSTSENYTAERLEQLSKLFDELVREATDSLENARERVDGNLWVPIQLQFEAKKMSAKDLNAIKREYEITIDDLQKAKNNIATFVTKKEKLV
jgi:polyhydroxyalkanoate synthesis regulator phasin